MTITKTEAKDILTEIYNGWDKWTPKNGSMAHRRLQALRMAITALDDRIMLDNECCPYRSYGECTL